MGKVFASRVYRQGRRQAARWGEMHWLVDDALIEGADLSVARMTLKEDACSESHAHPNCNEVVHLVKGTLEQSVGAERVVMQAGDTVFIPRGSVHGSRNIGRGEATVIVCYSAGSRIYEAVGKAGGTVSADAHSIRDRPQDL